MEYFLLYMLTLVIDINVGPGIILIILCVVGYVALTILDTFEGDAGTAKLLTLANKVAIVVLLWIGIACLSPSKEEAIFIAVGGMALQNDVDERMINLLGKTLDMSEEGITYITNELKALNETVPEPEAEVDGG